MPPMLPMLVATGELEFRRPGSLARGNWREKRKPANRVPSSFSKRDVRNCRPRPCGSASRFTSSWRLDAVIGLSRCLSHQTSNSSAISRRPPSRCFASLTRAVGSWQPSATKGSLTQWHQRSKLPSGRPGSISDDCLPHRQIVRRANNSSERRILTSSRMSPLNCRTSGSPFEHRDRP